MAVIQVDKLSPLRTIEVCDRSLWQSESRDRPSQAASTPLRGRPRQQPDEPRPRDSLPDPKLSQQQKSWISKVRGLDDGDDAGWDDVLSELMRAAGDSTPTTAPTDDTLSAEPSVTAK